MSELAVYRFTASDDFTGESIESPRFATLKAIKKCNGRSLEHTRRIVDSREIDGNGFLKPGAVSRDA
jgi:hypothetical protein